MVQNRFRLGQKQGPEAMRGRWKLLIGVGLVAVVAGLVLWALRTGLGPPEHQEAAASKAELPEVSGAAPVSARQQSGSDGLLDPAATQWNVRELEPTAGSAPADPARRPRRTDTPCNEAIGRWRLATNTVLVLAPHGEATRTEGSKPPVRLSWTCSKSGDVHVKLSNDYLTGRIGANGSLRVMGTDGTPSEWTRIPGDVDQ